MKKKLSVTIDDELIESIHSKINDGTFRNRSHAVEFALSRILKQEEEQK